jgi:hypothetical protein
MSEEGYTALPDPLLNDILEIIEDQDIDIDDELQRKIDIYQELITDTE